MLWGESAAVYCTTLLVLLLRLLWRDVLCSSRHVSVLFVSRRFSYTMNVQVLLAQSRPRELRGQGGDTAPHPSVLAAALELHKINLLLLLHCCYTAATLSAAAALPPQGSYTAPAAATHVPVRRKRQPLHGDTGPPSPAFDSNPKPHRFHNSSKKARRD